MNRDSEAFEDRMNRSRRMYAKLPSRRKPTEPMKRMCLARRLDSHR